jgi:alkylation response protein AidB-like acyl-CoA dehydrogenase
MDFARTEEQEMLRETARRFLDDKADLEVVRRVMDTDEGFDLGLWGEIAMQGWQAMAIPEEYGGAGFSFMEMAILMEEMGRSLFPVPYLSSIVLGAGLVLEAGTEAQKGEILPDVASGEARLAVAHLERTGDWGPGSISMPIGRDGDDIVLTGSKAYVIDGHTADSLIVAAREEGTEGEDGVTLVIVPAGADGLTTSRVETMDQTRKQASIQFDAVRVSSAAVLGDTGAGWDPLARTLQRASTALAFEQVGGAAACLDMAVAYAKERIQFGRPIGSFQAIKFKCADMLVDLESARSAAYYAGWTVTTDDPDQAIASSLAKAHCSDAYYHCAAENIQVHGGIGFTWEHDAHLYFKRAKTDELLFGTPADHRAALADRLGL